MRGSRRILGTIAAGLLVQAGVVLVDAEPAAAAIRCFQNDQGQTECVFVDDQGNPTTPPPPVVDLNLSRDYRIVQNGGQQCDDPIDGSPPQCYSGWNQDRATPLYSDWSGQAWGFETGVTQHSSVGPKGVSAHGRAYMGPDAILYGAYSFSELSIRFDVSRDTEYLLEGILRTDGWTDALWVSEDGQRVYEFLGSPDDTFSQVIQLLAGREYELYMRVYANEQSGYVGFDYALDFAQIPEPSTALLVALGLGGLATARRRRA